MPPARNSKETLMAGRMDKGESDKDEVRWTVRAGSCRTVEVSVRTVHTAGIQGAQNNTETLSSQKGLEVQREPSSIHPSSS